MGLIKNIYLFYSNGFEEMILGKKLWKIILIKLFIMFAILKFFFFPDYLNTKFHTDREKGNYVLEQMTQYAPHSPDAVNDFLRKGEPY